jgi:hypothetical protein
MPSSRKLEDADGDNPMLCLPVDGGGISCGPSQTGMGGAALVDGAAGEGASARRPNVPLAPASVSALPDAASAASFIANLARVQRGRMLGVAGARQAAASKRQLFEDAAGRKIIVGSTIEDVNGRSAFTESKVRSTAKARAN